jgi:hypothetical protein
VSKPWSVLASTLSAKWEATLCRAVRTHRSMLVTLAGQPDPRGGAPQNAGATNHFFRRLKGRPVGVARSLPIGISLENLMQEKMR